MATYIYRILAMPTITRGLRGRDRGIQAHPRPRALQPRPPCAEPGSAGTQEGGSGGSRRGPKINPEFSAEESIANDYYTYELAQELFLDGARKAGLPICATEALLAKDPDIKHLAECDERAHS